MNRPSPLLALAALVALVALVLPACDRDEPPPPPPDPDAARPADAPPPRDEAQPPAPRAPRAALPDADQPDANQPDANAMPPDANAPAPTTLPARPPGPGDANAPPPPDAAPPLEAEDGQEGAGGTGVRERPTEWASAREGDVLTYRLGDGATMIYEVKRVDDDYAYVDVRRAGDEGAADRGAERRMPRTVTSADTLRSRLAPSTKGEVQQESLGTETVTLSGRSYSCRVTRATLDLGDRTLTTRTWECDDVPGGVVKRTVETNGETRVQQELIAFERAQ